MTQSSYTILLTASINPNGMSYTLLQDVEERKAQYVNAINYYLSNTKCKLVFCNNSGEDIYADLHGNIDRLECLAFYGNDFDKTLGKGYGEYLIINYAFEHSRFIKKSKYIIKITGRLIVENLFKSISFSNQVWAFDSQKVFVQAHQEDNKMLDSRCFVGDKNFYRLFLSQKNMINDSKGYFFEHFLFDTIDKNGINAHFFVIPLCYKGKSGTFGTIYDNKINSSFENLVIARNYCELFRKNNSKLNINVLWISFLSLFIRLYKAFFK